MTESDRIKYLRVALLIVGLIFTFGLWPLTIVWPSGWAWHAGGRSDYLEMIFGIYATFGVFLMIASRDPMAHKSLIWFTGRCLGSNCCGGCISSLNASTDYRRPLASRGLTSFQHLCS
jgi:hypothetical protein